MITNVLTRVPSAGKFRSAAEVAASASAFRHCYTRKPSSPFLFTVSPMSTQNCIVAWSCRTEDGIPVPVPGSSPIRLFQRQDHHFSEPYRIELPSSLQKYTKMDAPRISIQAGQNLWPPHDSEIRNGQIVVVSSAEMAREIFQKNDQAFSGRPAPEAVVAEKDHDMSMVWSSGQSPHWKKLRKICNSQLFTAQRLDASQELRHMMMQKMIEQVDEACQARQPLNIGRLGFGTTLNVLSNTMFSSDMFDMKSDATTELKELISDLIELVGKPNVADYLPFLKPFDPQGIRRGLTLLYERLRKLLDGIIERRIKRRACGSDRYGNFLDVLLDHTEEDGPLELNHQNISVLLM
ncbi:UNVERIFIED_CONTAM: Geraniol 8-hydroxylase, partial [Sesamum radiatum]